MSTTRWIVGVVILIVIAGGWWVWGMFKNAPATSTSTPQEEVWNTYASSTLGLSVQYPPSYTADAHYTYTEFPGKPINGIKFTVSATMATGTNLGSDSGVSVEWLPRAKKCTADIYLQANVKAQKVTENGIDYSLATSSGAAAGNLYDEVVYALATSSPCTAVRYFIHSNNIANYPAGTVTEFNRTTLLADFDRIRASLVLER